MSSPELDLLAGGVAAALHLVPPMLVPGISDSESVHAGADAVILRLRFFVVISADVQAKCTIRHAV